MGKDIKISRGFLSLLALLLAFVLILVFIWLWYDLKNTSLEKEKQPARTAYLANNPRTNQGL